MSPGRSINGVHRMAVMCLRHGILVNSKMVNACLHLNVSYVPVLLSYYCLRSDHSVIAIEIFMLWFLAKNVNEAYKRNDRV